MGVGFGVDKASALTKSEYCAGAPSIQACGAAYDKLPNPATITKTFVGATPASLQTFTQSKGAAQSTTLSKSQYCAGAPSIQTCGAAYDRLPKSQPTVTQPPTTQPIKTPAAPSVPLKAETAVIQADCAARFPNDTAKAQKCLNDYQTGKSGTGNMYCYNTYFPYNGNANGDQARYNTCSAAISGAIKADTQKIKAEKRCQAGYQFDLNEGRITKAVADTNLAKCLADANSALATVVNTAQQQDSALTDCQLAYRQTSDLAAYQTCIANISTATAPQQETWYDWLKQGIGFLSEGALKVVLAVIGGLLQLVFLPVLSALLAISAYCLDIAIKFTLDTSNITQANGAVVATWVMVRNIFNITFIFVLLYTAIRTIIGSASANTKKMLANVIIAALLINFSMFIARIVIDFGNMIAVAFYNAAIASADPTINASASTVIGDILGLSALLNTTSTTSIWDTSFFIVSVIQIMTLIAALTTFLYLALLMLVRTVALIFLLATSPLGFVGDILPKLSEYAKLWRETLYGQVMIAPVFLLFFYLIINVGKTLSTTITSMPGIDQATLSFTAYFKYILIIILLTVAAKECKKMSGAIGSAIEGVVKAAVGIVIGAVTGGAAFAARATIGKGAAVLAQKQSLIDASKGHGVTGIAARFALRTSTGVSKASMDVRNTGGFKTATGFIGDQTGLKVDYSRGLGIQKGGYQGFIESSKKRAEDNTKLMGQTDDEKESGRKVKMIKDRDTLSEEKIKKEQIQKDAENEIADLRKKAAAGVDTSAAIAITQQKWDKAKERIDEIDGGIKMIEKDYNENFDEDLTKLTDIDKNNIKTMAGAARERQKQYLTNYQKTIAGRLEGLTLNLREKKKIAQEVRATTLKKETDIDKIIKGVSAKNPGSTTPPPPPTP